jgi:hypothetical protein
MPELLELQRESLLVSQVVQLFGPLIKWRSELSLLVKLLW